MVLLGLMASLAEGLGIGLLIPALDELLPGSQLGQAPGPLASQLRQWSEWLPADSRLMVLGLAILALVGLKTLTLIANTALTSWVGTRIAHDMRNRLTEAVLGMQYLRATDHPAGHLINLLETQAYRTGEAVAELSRLLVALCTVVTFSILLALLSLQLAIVVALCILPVSVFVWLMTRQSRRLGQVMVEAYSRLSGRAIELVTVMKSLRLLAAEKEGAHRIKDASDAVRRANLRSDILTGSIQPVVEFMYVPIFMVVLIYSASQDIAASGLVAFFALLYRLQSPLKRLDQLRVVLPSYTSGIGDIQALIEEARLFPAGDGGLASGGHSVGVEVRDITFRYPGQVTPSLDRVSLSLPPGKVIAVIGPSGSGKSTLAALLCRLFEPDSGEILVNGHPLADISSQEWRQRVAYAGQDMELIDGSVRDNLLLGLPGNATNDRLAEVLADARANEFLANRDGLDMRTGLQGRFLSGGQRQRIILARAFLRAPDLLILDEATNALDSETERAISEAIKARKGRCTMLVITHRLETIHDADWVYVLSQGGIVGEGTPAEMTGKRDLLAELGADVCQ
ncbi:MAG: ABC transporter ATP-binding protein [Steroidobacteraceae bacterium]